MVGGARRVSRRFEAWHELLTLETTPTPLPNTPRFVGKPVQVHSKGRLLKQTPITHANADWRVAALRQRAKHAWAAMLRPFQFK